MKPVNHNGKKSNVISVLKRKNMRLAKDIEEMDRTGLTPLQSEFMDKLQHNLRVCACPSLYSQGMTTGRTNYVASIRCDDKCCFICNFARQKMVRRRYMAWFQENQKILVLQDARGRLRYSTRAQRDKWPECRQVAEVEYDLMHLTLSVPHYPDKGFRGERYYYDTIAALYHRLRNKLPYFRDNVIGGEYGIETTNPDNLHIHIHSLLLVKRKRQSRNLLHYEILREWNRITANPDNPRTEIEPGQYPSVKAGNRLIDDDYVAALDPKGATIIGLEVIYTIDPVTGEKVRATEWNSEAMIRAVMETISYHFSPQTFDKSTGGFDLALLAEIKPVIYRKQLYRKFGVLHGEAALNIRVEAADGEPGELDVMQRVNIGDAVLDEETGELIEEPKRFVLTSPNYVFHDPDDNYKIHLSRAGRQEARNLKAHTTVQALLELKQIIKDSCK